MRGFRDIEKFPIRTKRVKLHLVSSDKLMIFSLRILLSTQNAWYKIVNKSHNRLPIARTNNTHFHLISGHCNAKMLVKLTKNLNLCE